MKDGSVQTAKPPIPPMVEDVSRPYRPRFREREYTWLNGVRVGLIVAACLCIAVFVIGEAVAIAMTVNVVRAPQEPDNAALAAIGVVAAHVVAQFGLIAGCLWPALIFLAAAQLLSLMMDVQANTQETAHYLRQISSKD